MLSKIKNSFLKAIKGEEDLWKVFWGWGVGVHCILFFLFFSDKVFLKMGFPSVKVQFDIETNVSLLSYLVALFGIPLYNILFISLYKKCFGNVKNNNNFPKISSFIFIIIISLYIQFILFIMNLISSHSTVSILLYYIFLFYLFIKSLITKSK